MHKTLRGLVLRETRYREADKILTVLTDTEGKLTVGARGALRKNCKYGAASQTLCYSEMTLFRSRGKWTLDEADTIEQFLPLREDIASLALAVYFAKLLEVVSDEDCPTPALLRLGLNSFYALSQNRYPQNHVKTVFELRLMCLAGFTPAVENCPVCGVVPEHGALFSLIGGTIHCRECLMETPGPSLALDGSALQALRYVVTADPRKIFSFSIPTESEECLSGISEAYVSTHLERQFPTLEYWKNLRV